MILGWTWHDNGLVEIRIYQDLPSLVVFGHPLYL